jgi:hypothetical protein
MKLSIIYTAFLKCDYHFNIITETQHFTNQRKYLYGESNCVKDLFLNYQGLTET